MCRVYEEVISPCKTSAHRGLRWQPAGRVGRLEIMDVKRITVYRVELIETEWKGIAVRLTKVDGTSYNVFAADNPRESECDCAGQTFGGNRQPCRHLQSVYALRANQWLDELLAGAPEALPMTDADVDQLARQCGAE